MIVNCAICSKPINVNDVIDWQTQHFICHSDICNKYRFGLFAACEYLHCSVCGTGDKLDAEDGLITYKFIKYRINTWTDNVLPMFNKFDNCVLELCKAAVAEYEHRDLNYDLTEIMRKALE